MSVLHLFIAILAAISVSIIISIINWIMQAQLSARINVLEAELNKKTAEFDAIRKERASLQVQAHKPIEVDMSTRLDEPIEPQLVDDGDIRIMRNVRGTFSHAKGNPPSAAYPDDPIPPDVRQEAPEPSPRPAYATPQQETFQDDTRRWQQKTPILINDDGPYRAAVPAAPAAVIIPLYSPAVGGTDFNAMYATLIEFMKSGSNQGVAFDCGGIQFLSDPEIEYLEKMCLSLAAQNRSLQLVNCSDSLLPALQQRRELAPFLR